MIAISRELGEMKFQKERTKHVQGCFPEHPSTLFFFFFFLNHMLWVGSDQALLRYFLFFVFVSILDVVTFSVTT